MVDEPGPDKFNLLESPLMGTNLIEASAGTGKTYTLAGLFLRLILEKRLLVGQILVVTYTVAATEELRHRIRTRLREAVKAFSSGASEDAFLAGLLKKGLDPGEAARLLEEALRNFDEAPVFTIHGFCQRVLHENAFECGSLFDTELMADPSGLMEEIARDFWRKNFYEAEPEFVAYAEGNNGSLPAFLKLLKNRAPQPDAVIVPECGPVELRSLAPLREAFLRMKASWPNVQQEVLEKLADPALNQNRYRKHSRFLEAMDCYLRAGYPVMPPFDEFVFFTPSEMKERTRKGQSTPEHPFFGLCEEFMESARALTDEMDRKILFLKKEFLGYLDKELRARKKKRNLQSFDDLLTRLRDALEKEGGEILAEAVRARYRAALIDEFQDTDPVQYAVFKNIFHRAGHLLFLIGDPKQAIYGFRGADLFTYMGALEDVDYRFTLAENWRSEPALVEAVNVIFSKASTPFIYDRIAFEEVAPGRNDNIPQLHPGSEPEPPFRIWFVDSKEFSTARDKGISKEDARDAIGRAVAGEISRLLRFHGDSPAGWDEKPLREADMAVLVRTNREAFLIQQALRELGIHSVLYTLENIFDAPETLEVARVLAAIAEPSQDRLIRAALATNMMGLTGEAIDRLLADDAGWEAWLARFRRYNEMWELAGFVRMFRFFLEKEGVRSRLLSFPDGERRLTNVLHLAEILHREAAAGNVGMKELLRWLGRMRDPDAVRIEENQLRLESDEDAVKVITIHKSKGLEYPVVFCPFNWNGSLLKKGDYFSFHDPHDDWRLHFVLQPDGDPHRAEAEMERLAENMRLLYVSLTRAKNRVYLVWGRFREAETSSLAYLLHQPEAPADRAPEAVKNRFSSLRDDEVLHDLEILAGKRPRAIGVFRMSAKKGEIVTAPSERNAALVCREFSGSIPRDWKIASFSFLSSGRKEGMEMSQKGFFELPDYEDPASAMAPVAVEEPAGIFAFPKGGRAGVLLHDIFEHLDFTGAEPDAMSELVYGKLREYGFGIEWQEELCLMIRRVLAVPLENGNGSFTLSDIRMENRISELGFYFPLKSITPETLKEVFSLTRGGVVHGELMTSLEKLDFEPVSGFMRGFMDLVFQYDGRFYLVDWKSNHLGNRTEDYGPTALVFEMERHVYVLQYHLYMLALHQYLKARLDGYDYDRHIGGVFYIFLRGVDPAKGPGYGIFRDRPAKKIMEALSEKLIVAE
jgi:exodeoxyribonuclease V beta subunit